jgi:murein DD-endopeptidase MepM/ murein hydrolase activator NlpD
MKQKAKILLILALSTFLTNCTAVKFILTGSGELKGVVTDRWSSEPLIGANVLLNETSFGASTDLNGEFQIKGIPAGVYELVVSYIGYKTYRKKIQIMPNQTTYINIALISEYDYGDYEEAKPEERIFLPPWTYKKRYSSSFETRGNEKPENEPEKPSYLPPRPSKEKYSKFYEPPRNEKSQPEPNPVKLNNFSPPLDQIYVSSAFGEPRNYGKHSGVDLLADCGSPVYAILDGIVTFAGYNGGYGIMIEIKHEDNLKSIYAHLSSILVKEGEFVNSGQVIGRVGNTGNSTGCHLHLEIIQNGEKTDPIKFLNNLK